MNTFTGLSPSVLRSAADIQEQILSLQDELNQILEGSTSSPAATPTAITAPKVTKGGKGKRRLSPEGLANIRAGVAKRKAARLAELGASATAKEPKSEVAPTVNRSRSEAMKASWAARRKAKK